MAKNKTSSNLKICMGNHTDKLYLHLTFYVNRPKNKVVMAINFFVPPPVPCSKKDSHKIIIYKKRPR